MSRLGQQVGGIYYKSPIVVASSPLTDHVDLIKRAEDNGAGAVSTKLTIIKAPVKGVRRMYAERNLYMFNPSDKRNELEDGVKLVRQVKEQTDMVVWTNIAGFGDDIDSWILIAKAMEEVGADALELNFNCPNMSVSGKASGAAKVGNAVSEDPELMREIISSLKEVIKIPIWVKSAFTNMPMNAQTIERAGADGIVVGGGILGAPPIDVFNRGAPKLPGAIKCSYGGAVGPVSRPLANRNLSSVKRLTDGIPLAGVGGIADYTHVIEKIMFGATLTCMCTKLLLDGFETIKTINEQLEKFMDEQGYGKLEDMCGLALEHLAVASDKLEYSFSVPAVDEVKCIGCGVCERIGSCRAISIEDKKAVVDKEKCEQCGLCVSLCPSGAIKY